MHAGGFPVDLVLLAMIAGFLVLRLRSILGRRTGFEGTPQPILPRPGPAAPPVIEAAAEPPAAAARALPDPASATGQTLAEIGRRDPRFDPAQFLAGAERAFRLIVVAFAAGDRARLRPLLGDDTYAAFDRAIAAREAAGDREEAEVRAIHDAALQEASLAGQIASITVRFVSEQINRVTGPDGQVRAGTGQPVEHADIWTFTRDLARADLAWRLAAAHSA